MTPIGIITDAQCLEVCPSSGTPTPHPLSMPLERFTNCRSSLGVPYPNRLVMRAENNVAPVRAVMVA